MDQLQIDSCLTDYGALCGTEFYSCEWADLENYLCKPASKLTVTNDIQILVCHRPGVSLKAADALSLGLKGLGCILESSVILGKQQLKFGALVSLLLFAMSSLSTFSPFDHTRNLTLTNLFCIWYNSYYD